MLEGDRKRAARHRLSWPRHERRHPWLSMLFNALAHVDLSVDEAIKASERPSACKAGCFHCCLQPIPLTPLEVLGIRFFIKEKLTNEHRVRLLDHAQGIIQLSEPSVHDGSPCPMLLEQRCAIYPVRPIACRRYNVVGEPCAPGEDCTVTRTQDVIRPSSEALREALMHTQPFYVACGLWKGDINDVSVFFSNLSIEIRSVEWTKY